MSKKRAKEHDAIRIVPLSDDNGKPYTYCLYSGEACIQNTLAFLYYLESKQNKKLKTLIAKITSLKYWYEYLNQLGIDTDTFLTLEEQYEFIHHLQQIENCNRKSEIHLVGKSTHKIGLDGRTIENHLANIREYYQYLSDTGRTVMPQEALPFRKEAKITLTKDHKRRALDVLTMDEVREIMDAATCIRDKAIILLCVSTGLRVGELCSLTIDALNFKNKTIRLVHDYLDLDTGVLKTGERILKGNNAAFELLQRYILLERNNAVGDIECRNVFVTLSKRKYPAGTPMTISYAKQIFTRLRNKTGIPNCHLHALRHTFATYFLSTRRVNGKQNTLPILQKLMGHKNANTTMIYTHIDYIVEDSENGKDFDKLIIDTFSDMLG